MFSAMVIGNDCPPSVERKISTVSAETGAILVFATSQLINCTSPATYEVAAS